MMKIMDLIFEGQIYPEEQAVPDSPEYRSVCRTMSDTMERLSKELSPKEYDEIEKLCDLVAYEDEFVNKECFRYGFGLGILLMQEVYQLQYFKASDKNAVKKDTREGDR